MSIVPNDDVRESTFLVMSCHFVAAFGGMACGPTILSTSTLNLA